MDSSFASPVGKEIAAISAKQRVTVNRYLTDSPPIPHRQSTDTLATVDRNISAEESAECRPTYRLIVSTDGLLTKTTCRPTYRPIVSTDTRPTDALSTHDPKLVSALHDKINKLIFIYKTMYFQQISLLRNT